MPTTYSRRRRGPKPERRRALELLTASPDGCSEAIMLAQGFTVDFLVDLIRTGMATTRIERVVAGGRCGSPARLVFIDETWTTTNIASEAARNFCIWRRGYRRSGRISLAWSQTYPTRPVHWIVSFSECGPNDIVAWLNGQTCQKNWVNNSSVNGAQC